jgi:hypothetical protein
MSQDTTVREHVGGEGAEAGVPGVTGGADEEARVAKAIGQDVAQRAAVQGDHVAACLNRDRGAGRRVPQHRGAETGVEVERAVSLRCRQGAEAGAADTPRDSDAEAGMAARVSPETATRRPS